MKRKIIKIHQDKCNGCGACAQACHEGAIAMIDGKAHLISDRYCDGLGDCLPVCPTGAIEIIEREAEAYDEEAVKQRMAELPCGCPGSREKKILHKPEKKEQVCAREDLPKSQLGQWPVQLSLINSDADCFNGANLLIAADCTAYAYGNFHYDFIKDHVTVIGCPKLDDSEYYREKLTAIFKKHAVKSVTVVRMEVPCCGGLVLVVKEAMLAAQIILPYREITISVEGEIR